MHFTSSGLFSLFSVLTLACLAHVFTFWNAEPREHEFTTGVNEIFFICPAWIPWYFLPSCPPFLLPSYFLLDNLYWPGWASAFFFISCLIRVEGAVKQFDLQSVLVFKSLQHKMIRLQKLRIAPNYATQFQLLITIKWFDLEKKTKKKLTWF